MTSGTPKTNRKRSASEAGLSNGIHVSKAPKLTQPHKLHNGPVHPSVQNRLVDIAPEILDLIVKFLSPKERLRLFTVSIDLKHRLLNRDRTVWNDIRVSLKFKDPSKRKIRTRKGLSLPLLQDNPSNTDPVTLQFIPSQTMYCRKDNPNCIEIVIDRDISDSTLQVVIERILKCIPSLCNVEIFKDYHSIYDSVFIKSLPFHHTKYLTLDCLDVKNQQTIPNLIKLFPNICFLSILNVIPIFGTKGQNAFKRIFTHFKDLNALQYLQFYDCSSACFEGVVSNDSILLIHQCITNIVSLDFSFCAFAQIVDIQNILDMIPQLKFLSFVSNGIDLKHQKQGLSTLDVDQEFATLQIKETVEYLKYAPSILTDHRMRIHLDLSEMARTQSLRFVDCCIDDIVFLDEISKHCDKVQYVSLLYDRDSTKFLRKYWSKYPEQKLKDKVLVAVESMDGEVEDKGPLGHVLQRMFCYEMSRVMTRNALYRRYFDSKDSHIVEMSKVDEATDFFKW